MRGSDGMQEALFTVAKLEDFVPSDHPLRPIRILVNEALVQLNGLFNDLYANHGRPSIPPEKLMRALLLLQVFYSVRSERQICEQLRYNLLFRWFVGLAIDDAVWDHSVFSKNRDRLLEHAVVEAFFSEIMRLAADFQWCDLTTFVNCFEISTNLPPAPPPVFGGRIVYEKTVFVPFRNLFVQFSGQGDSHEGLNGQSARLHMARTIDTGDGERFCNPHTGLPDAGIPVWMTLLKLPNPDVTGTGGCGVAGTGDGGGGSGDCHDNALYATWCIPLENPGPVTVRLRLASDNGGTVFYERAHIYLDMTPNKNADNRCINIAPPPA
jgi:transposase